MRKIAVVLTFVVLAVTMVGCGGTAEQTSGSSYTGSSYNSDASSYK